MTPAAADPRIAVEALPGLDPMGVTIERRALEAMGRTAVRLMGR